MKKINFNFLFTFIFFLVIYLLPAYFSPFDVAYYESLTKPRLTPPEAVFPIVWTILYTLLALASTIVFTTNLQKEKEINAYSNILLIHYIFLQLYSFIQFEFQNQFLALIDILLILITTIMLIVSASKLNKIADYLIVPLLLWVLFATYLQTALLILN